MRTIGLIEKPEKAKKEPAKVVEPVKTEAPKKAKKTKED